MVCSDTWLSLQFAYYAWLHVIHRCRTTRQNPTMLIGDGLRCVARGMQAAQRHVCGVCEGGAAAGGPGRRGLVRAGRAGLRQQLPWAVMCCAAAIFSVDQAAAAGITVATNGLLCVLPLWHARPAQQGACAVNHGPGRRGTVRAGRARLRQRPPGL